MYAKHDYSFIRKKIENSNIVASNNRNLYPIQEQATLLEIWERVEIDVSCNSSVEQNSFVYVLKDNLTFHDVMIAFLRMFTDNRQHTQLIKLLSSDYNENQTLPPRIKGAYIWLSYLKSNWSRLYSIARKWRRTLFCQRFIPQEIISTGEWDFDIRDSVYRSKLWAILFPDICVPFDSRSKSKISKYFGNSNIKYSQMLTKLRKDMIQLIQNEDSNLNSFRMLDDLARGCPFDPMKISLSRSNFDYGNTYEPAERPVSRVIDKYFYDPGRSDNNNKTIRESRFGIKNIIRLKGNITMKHDNCEGGILPLSGRGNPIKWQGRFGETELKIYWGQTFTFNLNVKQQNMILNDYFATDNWYPLGASMDNPTKGGLGEYMQNKFNKNPRTASAIAAILVYLQIIEYKVNRTIYLRKRKK